MFFRHLVALDAEADKLESLGKSGADLRDHVQAVLGPRAERSSNVEAKRRQLLAALELVDKQADAIIRQTRALFPGGMISQGTGPPCD